MSTYEFTVPEYLEGYDSDTVHMRMMENLPDDIDDMPGGFPWDFTYPSALEVDRVVNDAIIRTLMSMFPQFAHGEFLDLHGAREGITRRQARPATAVLKIVGSIGTEIPEGTVFCTPATMVDPSIQYTSDEYHIISTGIEMVTVTAVEDGVSGNTMAGTITLMQDPIEGIASITNLENVHDGTDIEDDDTYRDRIIEACQAAISNVGNPADYVRWAKEISGVGIAVCISEWNGPGTVALVIRDNSGEPASQSILNDVYDHVAKKADSLDRLAPIGATLTVKAPSIVNITFAGKINVEPEFDPAEIIEIIRTGLDKYLSGSAIVDEVIRYSTCFALVKDCVGVKDLYDFKINGSSGNIAITREQYPKIKTLNISAE